MVGQAVFAFVEGDITKVPADAIVNAANSRLAGGGGVDGAIHRAGGPVIMAELEKIRASIGQCPAGGAVITGAGELPAKYVIHAVGPVYQDGSRQEAEKLASCYETSMRLAEEHGVRSISFPSISTGAYGYPLKDAAEVAIRTVAERLRRRNSTMQRVSFVLFGKAACETHLEVARRELGS